MRVRHLLLASMMVLGLVGVTTSAHAAPITFDVEVLVDSGGGFVSQGTATAAGGAILDVNVNSGDTVRFIVGIGGGAGGPVTSYSTTVNTDDPSEIDYSVGSGTNLAGAGLNFALAADPDSQLNDGTPATGTINSVAGSAAVTDFYSVDYVVQAGINSDANVDFSVTGILSTTAPADSSTGGSAQVRLNAGVPEPASMLLLGSGLAGLAGFGRKKFRK